MESAGPLDHDAERQEHGQHEGPDSAGDLLERKARDVGGDIEVDRDGGVTWPMAMLTVSMTPIQTESQSKAAMMGMMIGTKI